MGDIHDDIKKFGRQVSLQSATLDLVRGELNLFPWKRTLGQGESEKVNGWFGWFMGGRADFQQFVDAQLMVLNLLRKHNVKMKGCVKQTRRVKGAQEPKVLVDRFS